MALIVLDALPLILIEGYRRHKKWEATVMRMLLVVLVALPLILIEG